MHRRSFILLATGGLANVSLTANPAAASLPVTATVPGPAIIRTGQRILATLPPAALYAVRRVVGSLPAEPGPDLQQRISADHRAGRTITLDGIRLSVTEAAWCLTAAADRGPLS